VRLCLVECGAVYFDMYQHFGGTCCLHLQGRGSRQQVAPKLWYLSTQLRNVTCQKPVVSIIQQEKGERITVNGKI
jgi:hypothetical protein